MSADINSKAEPWHRRFGRDKFLRPWLLLFIAGLYVFIYSIVAALTFVLGWIVPHLPWIPKPYVSPDPPPLVTAFYCANLFCGSATVLAILVYLGGPTRRILAGRKRRRSDAGGDTYA